MVDSKWFVRKLGNKEANAAYKNAGNCETSDEGITFKEYTPVGNGRTASEFPKRALRIPNASLDTNAITKTNYCLKGKLVTLEEGETLVKSGNAWYFDLSIKEPHAFFSLLLNELGVVSTSLWRKESNTIYVTTRS